MFSLESAGGLGIIGPAASEDIDLGAPPPSDTREKNRTRRKSWQFVIIAAPNAPTTSRSAPVAERRPARRLRRRARLSTSSSRPTRRRARPSTSSNRPIRRNSRPTRPSNRPTRRRAPPSTSSPIRPSSRMGSRPTLLRGNRNTECPQSPSRISRQLGSPPWVLTSVFVWVCLL